MSYLPSKTMGCFSGCLMSAASDQKLFCKLCSPFCCSFDEFVESDLPVLLLRHLDSSPVSLVFCSFVSTFLIFGVNQYFFELHSIFSICFLPFLILLCALGLKICILNLSEAIQCQYYLLLQTFTLCLILYTLYSLLNTKHLLLKRYTLPTTLQFCCHLLHIGVWF